LFWNFQLSQVVGNVIAAYVLRSGADKSTLFLVFGVMAVVGALVFLCLRMPPDREDATKQTEADRQTELMNPSTMALSVGTELLSRNTSGATTVEEGGPIQEIKDTFHLMLSPRMLQILPLVVWSAASMTVYGSIFIPMLIRTMLNKPEFLEKTKQDEASLTCLCFLGAGEMLGAPMYGQIRDRIGNKAALVFLLLLTIGSIAVFLYINQIDDFSYFSAYLMTLTWGLQDGGVNILIICLMGFEFESNIIPFSVFNFIQSISVFALLIIASAVMDPDFTPPE
jgi:fucose permease